MGPILNSGELLIQIFSSLPALPENDKETSTTDEVLYLRSNNNSEQIWEVPIVSNNKKINNFGGDLNPLKGASELPASILKEIIPLYQGYEYHISS